MHATTALILGAATVALVGCTINTNRPVTGVYVGVVYFKTSMEESAPLHRTDIKSFGFWSDNNAATDKLKRWWPTRSARSYFLLVMTHRRLRRLELSNPKWVRERGYVWKTIKCGMYCNGSSGHNGLFRTST